MPDVLFSAVIERYQNEISVKKRGARNEIMRLNRFWKYDIVHLYLRDLRKEDFERWRELRLMEVSEASVRREMVTISNVLTVAAVAGKTSMIGVEKPKNSAERTQRYSQ